MTTESLLGYGTHVPTAPQSVIHRDAAGWILTSIADGHREATLSVDADERFWRLRRAHGNTVSMFEAALTVPATAREVAQAIVRWASSVGLSAKMHLANPENPENTRGTGNNLWSTVGADHNGNTANVRVSLVRLSES